MNHEQITNKIITIGLDGGTWKIIYPLVEQGELPALRKLIENGAHGILNSTIPPVTVPAWPAFYTGKNPGKFGVFDFVKRDLEKYRGNIVLSSDVKSLKLWDYLRHKKCVIINMPLTYPVEPLNGIMISGLIAPPAIFSNDSLKDNNQEICYPKSIQTTLKTLNYKIEPDAKKTDFNVDDKIFIDELLSLIEIRTDTFLHFIKNSDWDYFFGLYRETDIIQHRLMQDPEALKKIYKKIDDGLLKILQNIDNNTTLFLMSDHGFTNIHRWFFINTWLEQQGYTIYKKEKEKKISEKILNPIGLNQENLMELITALHLNSLIKKIPLKYRKVVPTLGFKIDWSKSTAYFGNLFSNASTSININLRGREPEGIVEQKDYDTICDSFISQLLQLKDPTTGKNVVKNAYKRQKLYTGPFIHNAPDITFILEDGYWISSMKTKSLFNDNPLKWGRHEIEGIFLAYGKNIRENYQCQDYSILDVLPTILYGLSSPVPDDLDGKIMFDIFTDASELPKPDYVTPDYFTKKMTEKEKILQVCKKLKKL